MLKALHIAFRTLLWILIGCGLAVVVLVIRLNQGPIALDWLQPRIEQALAPDNARITVESERIELRFNRERRTLEVAGVDVAYRIRENADGPSRTFLTFPNVEIMLSTEAFLGRGMIAASQMTASAPSLTVTRDEEGVIGLYSGRDEETPGNVDFGNFLRRFVEASEAEGRLAYLQRLQISGGRITYDDRARAKTLTAEASDLVLTRREGGVEGEIRTEIAQPSGARSAVSLTARSMPDADEIVVHADIKDLMPPDLKALWPLDAEILPTELSGLRLPVAVTVDGMIDLTGAISPLDVAIEAGPGTIDLPDHLQEPIAIERGALKGRLADDFRAAEIETLFIEARGATLDGQGDVTWREDERKVALDADIRGLRAEDLPAFWPPDLGSAAREWVVENIRTGRVPEGHVKLDLTSADFGAGPLRDEAIDGRFAFEGLSVRYMEEMPPLEAAVGETTFDADRMHFDVESGENAGVTLTGGSVTITGMGQSGDDGTRLRVLADVEGSIDKGLSLLDHPPLGVAKELSIVPETASGSFSTRIEVTLPLHDEVSGDDAVVVAEADLRDAALARLPKLGDAALDDGAFKLSVGEETVRLAGTAEVSGIEMAIDITEPLDETSGQRRRIGLKGRIDAASLALADPVADVLVGELGFEATVTETASNFWIDLDADLEAAAITPPGIDWTKPAGAAGRLRASIMLPLDGPAEVKQFELQTDDLNAAGTLRLEPGNAALSSLTLSAFRYGDTDGAVRLTMGEGGRVDLTVEARTLDLDTLFGEGGEIDPAFERFHVAARIDRLLARGLDLRAVEADGTHAAEGWRTASLLGTLASGSKVALELAPDGGTRRLEFRSEDAGALIQALDFGTRVKGGSVLMSATLPADEETPKQGRIEVKNFLLEDAPLLARMLTLASLTGIGNLLEGEGIHVDDLILPITADGDVLTVTDGLMRGSQLGLTIKGDLDLERETLDLAGTIIPVYGLNRLIGKVPVIGQILTGEEGRGAFAATYSIKGPRNNPNVYVNPLSILTPGFIRDLFGGILNGTLEAPEVRETDD